MKIDKSFLQNLDSSSENTAIVTALIQLSKALGVKTIAQGVETKQQCQFLLNNDCEYLQGYLIDHPMSVQQLIDKYTQ